MLNLQKIRKLNNNSDLKVRTQPIFSVTEVPELELEEKPKKKKVIHKTILAKKASAANLNSSMTRFPTS